MPTLRSTASHASVAFLRIHDFAQQAVADQARLKSRLEEVVTKVLETMSAEDRIVLDAPEGLAVVVLANPRAALRLAWRTSSDRELGLAVGLAHGPVRVQSGPLAVVCGDALVAAEGVARATASGGVSASREFRDAITRARPGMRRLLVRSGTATDAQERAHEMYRADQGSFSRRRTAFYGIAGVVAAGILSIGIGIQLNRPPPAPPAPPPPPPEIPGAVTFDIKPEGEVYVNGMLKGMSPPLKRIQLPAGVHLIELRSGSHKPVVTELAIGPGEEFAVQHSFVVAPQPPVVKPAVRAAKPPAKKAPPKDKGKEVEKPFWERFMDLFK